jgi:hypothetical protein
MTAAQDRPASPSFPERVLARARLLALLLEHQDNAATALPIFCVQQRERLVGVDDGYTDDFVWMDDDWQEVEPPADEDHPPAGWTRIGVVDRWSFVSCFLTRCAAEAYIAANGHRMCDPRIYVESGYRNGEWAFMRELITWLGTDRGFAEYCERAASAAEGDP